MVQVTLPGPPTDTTYIGYDAMMRPILEYRPNLGVELYKLYDEFGNVRATLSGGGLLTDAYVFEGTDAPLSIARAGTTYYYEVDLAGNVRRLRASGGLDKGGYKYSSFGRALAADSGTPVAGIDQPLRWKSRWYYDYAGGLYEIRARWWSPDLGTFLQIDRFEYQDGRSTLWGWPRQNPMRFRDPTGRWGWDNDRVEMWALSDHSVSDVATGFALLEGAIVVEAGLGALGVWEGLGLGGGAAAAGGAPAANALANSGGGAANSCPASGTALAQNLGAAGESAAGIIKNTERIASASGTASYRIPDGLDHAAKVLSEVKNVDTLSYTSQLRDFSSYAAQQGYAFELWVRPTTQLSGPLQDEVNQGNIILRFLP